MRNTLLLSVLFAGISTAQQPPQPQPMQPGLPIGSGEPRALKAYLGLTDDQLEQMHKAGDAAHKAAIEKVKTMQPQLEQRRAALRDLLLKGSPDPKAIGKAMLEMRAVEKQIGEAHEVVRKAA